MKPPGGGVDESFSTVSAAVFSTTTWPVELSSHTGCSGATRSSAACVISASMSPSTVSTRPCSITRSACPACAHATSSTTNQRTHYHIQVTPELTDEIDLHTFLPKECADVVEEYLFAAQEAGFTTVRIIHG